MSFQPNCLNLRALLQQKNVAVGYLSPVPTFGQNLKRLRQAAGFKLSKDLATALDVTPPVVSAWENDQGGLPETPTLFKLAKTVKCRVEDLLEGIDPDYDRVRETLSHNAEELDIDVTNYTREDIPVIQEGEASPSGLAWDVDPRPASEADRTSRPYDFREKGAYAVVLHGDSMEPLLKRGMRLIVSVRQAIADGDLAYVQLRSGERLAKIATRMTDAWLLTSANPAHPPRHVRVDEILHIHKVAYVRFLK